MKNTANVSSFAAVQKFRADLVTYQEQLRSALDQLTIELGRGMRWFETQSAYWPAEVRRSLDRVAGSRTELDNCMIAQGEGRPSACLEQRQAFHAAKARLTHAEQQVRVTKKWNLEVGQETDQFRNRLAQLMNIVETELPLAIADLDRILALLERYAQISPSEAARIFRSLPRGGTSHGSQ